MELFTDITARCEALRQDMTLRKIYALTNENPGRVAAHYLEGDSEKSLTFAQYDAWVRAFAAHFSGALGAEKQSRFVAIQLDTCKEWYAVFWGLMQAGYNALLIDANLGDEMTAFMLKEGGGGLRQGRPCRLWPAGCPGAGSGHPHPGPCRHPSG